MSSKRSNEPLVYLDHAATTAVRAEVRQAMAPFLGDETFGNPSSSHRFGRTARAALEDARRRIATALEAEPGMVVFTSGGTEADNLAVLGTALRARSTGRPFRVSVAASEHKAVLDAARAVEHLGGEVRVLPVGPSGGIDVAAAGAALEEGLALLSVMWVNNETGVVQDVSRLAHLASTAGSAFHTDAVQAVGKVACTMSAGPISLLAISGHKIGAPKGIGALIVRDRDVLEPLLHGGGQQGGLRPGTENVAGAVGLAVAVELAVQELPTVTHSLEELRGQLERRLVDNVPDLQVNAATVRRAPHISNVSIPGAEGSSLLAQLDQAGVACSSGSACNTGAAAPSHVLTAMGVPNDLAGASLRFSFSRESRLEDIHRVIEVLPAIVSNARRLSTRLTGGGRP
jgi:cysteine desulfurase